MTNEKKLQSDDGGGSIFSHEDFDPVTYWYIMLTAIMFAVVGVNLIVQVVKGASKMGKSHTADSLPPNEVTIAAPNACAGSYALHGESNGYPTWKHKSEDLYLYSGTDGRWLVGGTAEKNKGFACNTGMIGSVDEHEGVFPQGVGSGTWGVFDGNEFVPDKINVLHQVPERLEVQTAGLGAGTYIKVPDQQRNGYPVWANEDGQYWLYSGLAGQWFVGGVVEQAAAFACDTGVVASITLHDGAMPNQLGQGNWMTFVEDQWTTDPNTNVAVSIVSK
jgi:hypothetical protein